MAGSQRVPPGCPLTARQHGVVVLLAAGYTQRQVASHFGMSRSAVCNHANAAIAALNCKNITHVVATMTRHGWLTTDSPVTPPAPPEPPLEPFLAAYVAEFERSRWPNEPDAQTTLGMRLALAGHRNSRRP